MGTHSIEKNGAGTSVVHRYCHAHAPDPRLAPYIRCYFHIRVANGGFDFPADGCPGLIINLKNPFRLGFYNKKAQPITGCRLFGASTRQMLTRHPTGPTELLAVKFYPGQIPRFFDLPAMALTDTSVSLFDVWGTFGKETQERFVEEASIQAIIGRLDRALIRRLSLQRKQDDLVAKALDTIFECGGRISVEHLAHRFNIVRRHLERRFLATAGLSPKRVCRIARFLNVFSPLNTTHADAWAQLALAAGYSDQAHLIRECKFFTGRSPLAYLKTRSRLEHTILGMRDITKD